MNKRTWFWDLETLKDIFTATFVDKDSDEIKTFVISDYKDQTASLFRFLEDEVYVLIGYNSIYFDAQVIEFCYRKPDFNHVDIAKYADLIINTKDRKPDIPDWDFKHIHIDLFKALSLSTKSKRTGLKWCEFMIDFENIEDLPEETALDPDEREHQVLSYNLNDVLATKALYFKYEHEITLRNVMSKKEGINLLNSTEPDMAKKLFGKYLSKAMGISQNELKNMGTERDLVDINDIIFPYIDFESDQLKDVLSDFRQQSLTVDGKFEKEITFGDVIIKFGLGGIHAAPKNKKVDSTNKKVIKSFDATSYYPHLFFKNGQCPAHLNPDIFLPLYENLFHERAKIPKKDPRNYILKICLNALYGLTNDKHSFVRDRLITLSICINGQLLLTMLVEKLTREIPDCQMIMMNTDGAEVIMPIEYEDKYQEICKWWEELTQIPLEHVEYQSLIISDVNNYIAILPDGTTKCKGKFEFDGMELPDGKIFRVPLHKNKSFAIIPRAIYHYFVNDTPIEDTILNHINIFDFCAGKKAGYTENKGKSWYELTYVKNKKVVTEKLSKTVRYFISKDGKFLTKCYEDGSKAASEAPLKRLKTKKPWKVTYFNKYYKEDNIKDYNIDYSYYIHKSREIIDDIKENSQLTLF